MDVAVLGPEERQVRAARRFGRIGLVLTFFWLLIVPVAMLLIGSTPPVFLAVLLPLYVTALGLHVWRIRSIMRSLGEQAPAWFVIVTSVVGLALILVGLTSGYIGFSWALVGGILLGDVVGGMPARRVALWVVASVVVVFWLGRLVVTLFPPTLQEPGGGPAVPVPPTLQWIMVGLATFYVACLWYVDVERLWWLKAVTDLDDSRRSAAELATARERLRLSDDLHDILGHALEVVAFKSELAARLQAVDPGRARAEMEEVQRVARQSLSEVRALVHDARTTDLVTELAGARAVLESAGVALVVDGDPAELGPTARNVFGRVLREAMTNVLRHAHPRHCTIQISCSPAVTSLRIVNDGVLPPGADDSGTGLVALRRYLAEHAGRLDAGPADDGTFRLSAELPAAVS